MLCAVARLHGVIGNQLAALEASNGLRASLAHSKLAVNRFLGWDAKLIHVAFSLSKVKVRV